VIDNYCFYNNTGIYLNRKVKNSMVFPACIIGFVVIPQLQVADRDVVHFN